MQRVYAKRVHEVCTLLLCYSRLEVVVATYQSGNPDSPSPSRIRGPLPTLSSCHVATPQHKRLPSSQLVGHRLIMITRQSSIPLSRIDALFHLHPTKYMAARSAPTTVGRRRMRWLKPPPVPLRYKLRLAWILQPTSSPPISQRLQQAAPVTAIPSTPRPRSCQRPEDGQAQMNEKIQKAQSFILAKFGYDIGSSPMLYEAINIAGDHTIQAQKASLDLNPDRRQSQTNKRLAHVGDAAIGAVIKIHGFRHGLSRGLSSL